MLLLPEQITKKLLVFTGWEYTGEGVSKTYMLEGFIEAVEAINKIAVIAEHVVHHPDVSVHNYNKLTVFITSHDEGGVTEKDIKLAAEIEKMMALEI